MTFAETINPRLTMALVWATLAAGTIYLFLFEPGKTGFFPVCPFRAITGFTCPGCGSTRGLHRLLHGDVVAAFEFNPLLIVSLPFLLYALMRYTNAAIREKPLKGNQLNAKYIWLLFGVIMFFWIYRNTPFYPFVS
jgi:hypothetical protein